jgi:hypothetical protein
MGEFLEKISWLTRRWNFKFRLFDLYLHDEFDAWGFEFFTIQYDYRAYSALALLVRLPNKTTVKEFVIDDWDFLFLERPLFKLWERLDDKKTWGGDLSKVEKLILRILNKIIK